MKIKNRRKKKKKKKKNKKVKKIEESEEDSESEEQKKKHGTKKEQGMGSSKEGRKENLELEINNIIAVH